MRKSFLTNLLFVLLVNLLVKPLYLFGVEVGVQNRLGAEVYGLYFALLNSAFLLQIINDFGIQVFNNRQVSIDRSSLRELFPGFVALKLILSVAYLILLYVLGRVLGYTQLLPLLLFIGINLILTSFVLFFRSGISGLGYYRIDSALSVMDKLLMLLIIGSALFLLRNDHFTIYHFVFGQMAALALTAFISWALLRRYTSLALSFISFRKLRGLAKSAMPYALAVFLMTLYTRLDGVMIMGLLPDGEFEAGVYAAGYRILDAFNMVAFLFAVLLLPMFSGAQSSLVQLRTLLDEGFRYMLLLVVPVCVLGILMRQELMSVLYIQANAYWGAVFCVLIATFVLTGMMYVFGTLLTATGRIRSMNVVFATTVVLNIFFNAWLIPQYKAEGAAIATLITQFCAFCGILVLCFRAMPIGFSGVYAARVMGFCVFSIASGLLVIYLSHRAWALVICGYTLCVLSGAFIFRVIRLSELRSLIKRA